MSFRVLLVYCNTKTSEFFDMTKYQTTFYCSMFIKKTLNYSVVEIRMKKLNLISLAMLLLMLCGCSGGGIMDTYWRNDKTGDWLIGLTEDRVIYDCKVWDIASKNESDGAYSILVENGADKLDISIGTENDGKRTISIDGKTF